MGATDQQESYYLQVLGLSRPPFAREATADLFYEEPGCKNCLDLLLHLARFGESVLLVSGAVGSGKSTLVEQFLARLDSSVFICRIDANAALDIRQLEDLLLAELDINNVFDRKQGINKILKNRLEAINRKYSTVILLIDNVDKLPVTLLSFLQKISVMTDGGGSMLLHLVLFAKPQVEIKLNELFADKLKILKLSPYSLEETSKYLQYRLHSADSPGEQFSEIFDSVSILNIYKLSDGLPAQINKLAHNKLLEVADKKSPSLEMKKLIHSSQWQWLTSTLLIGIIALAWFFPNDIRRYVVYIHEEYKSALLALGFEFPSLTKDVVPKESPTKETVSSEGVFKKSSSTMNQDSEAAVRNPGLASGLASGTAEANTKKVPAQDQALILAGTDKSNQQTAIKTTMQTPVQTASGGNMPHEIRREKWLLSQQGQKYTLQLFGTKDEADISRIVKRYNLNGQLAYYRTQKKGGQWFGLTYGVYSDLREAQGAAKQLPRRLKNDVWVRKLYSIHQEIQKSGRK